MFIDFDRFALFATIGARISTSLFAILADSVTTTGQIRFDGDTRSNRSNRFWYSIQFQSIRATVAPKFGRRMFRRHYQFVSSQLSTLPKPRDTFSSSISSPLTDFVRMANVKWRTGDDFASDIPLSYETVNKYRFTIDCHCSFWRRMHRHKLLRPKCAKTYSISGLCDDAVKLSILLYVVTALIDICAIPATGFINTLDFV